MDIYAKPEDREKTSLYVREIETDHKPGPDGNLIAVDRIIFGKHGTNTYEQIYEVGRLQKDNPKLWAETEQLYEQWKKHQTIVRDGLNLKAWPAITKGQIKACEGLGLFTVEDIATATSSIREKLGMGANELVDKAKAWVANKDASAVANELADLRALVKAQADDLKTAQETIDAVMAEKGKRPSPPRKEAA
jgi:hypothetical protein